MHHVHIKITGPDGKIVHQGERESNGKYTFAAHMDGVYKYCFSNQKAPHIISIGYNWFTSF